MEERARWTGTQGTRGQHTFRLCRRTDAPPVSHTLLQDASPGVSQGSRPDLFLSPEGEQSAAQFCPWSHCQEASDLRPLERRTGPRVWPSAR